ncbi:hypothetical protein [Lentisalinibacter sediminis]|uniref:hypothetical protein n=1 Tax=Lentisalinibacter sediminis TaxID=2992237 RepID=UPI00386614D3
MTEQVIAIYSDAKTIKNVEDDLRAVGIPSEKIYPDPDNRRIRVVVPEAARAEILEILNRHKPEEVR